VRLCLFSRSRPPKDALLAAANARKHLGVRAVIHTTMGDMYVVALRVAHSCFVTASLQLPQTFRRIRAENCRKLLHAFSCRLLRRLDISSSYQEFHVMRFHCFISDIENSQSCCIYSCFLLRIQTGDPMGDGTGGASIWGGEFEDEFHK
jgi:hypothetical protein